MVSKDRKKTSKAATRSQLRGRPGATGARESARRGRQQGGRPPRNGPRRGKRAVFRFVAWFAILMILFQVACATSFVKDTLFPGYLRFNAAASAAILAVFEDSVTVSGQSIQGRYSLTIERGCDAIEPSALFLAGVLAFPAALTTKLPGMLIGTLVLLVLNLVRIISLFYVGVYFPRMFHVMHVDVWQSVFVFLAILFWILWAVWATREKAPKANAAAQVS